MTRALLFDNDGVLADTEPLFFEATRAALASLGVDLSHDHYLELSLRLGRSCFVLAEERGVGPDEILRAREARDAHYSELISAGVPPIDGVRECLEVLAGSVPMAVVTSSTRDFFELIHARSGLLDFFEFVLASGDYARHKPHPDPYLGAAERLGVDPGDCVAVEDTERGLEAATRAGMRCLVVPTALTRGARFASAHRVLGSAREIPELLGL